MNLNKKICIRNNFHWCHAQNLHSSEREINECIVLGGNFEKEIRNLNAEFYFTNILQRERKFHNIIIKCFFCVCVFKVCVGA